MKITLNNKAIELKPEDLENSAVTFSCLRGRKFSYKSDHEVIFNNVSLNSLLLAVNKEEVKSENLKDMQAFVKIFKALENKGYAKDGQINKSNFFSKLITKIKHLFAQIFRNKIFDELSKKVNIKETPLEDNREVKLTEQPEQKQEQKNQFLEAESLQNVKKDVELPLPIPKDEIKVIQKPIEQTEVQKVETLQILSLPADVLQEILLKCDYRSLLTFYRTSKVGKIFIENKMPSELKKARFKTKLEKDAFIQWKEIFEDFTRAVQFFSNEVMDLIQKFMPSYSEQMFKKIKHLSKPTQGRFDSNLFQILKIFKMFPSSYSQRIIDLLKKYIQIILKKEYDENQFKELVKTLASIEAENNFSLENLNFDFNEQTLTFIRNYIGAFERDQEFVNLVKNQQIKVILKNVIKNHDKFGQETLDHVTKALRCQNSDESKEELLYYVSEIYAEVGLLEESAQFFTLWNKYSLPTLVNMIKNSTKCKDQIILQAFLFGISEIAKNEVNKPEVFASRSISWKTVLLELAKIYSKVDPSEIPAILSKIPQNIKFHTEFYASYDLKKAKEIANGLDNLFNGIGEVGRIDALLGIADLIKHKNLESANEIWESIVPLIKNIRANLRSFILLKIAHQQMTIDHAKALEFLKKHLEGASIKDNLIDAIHKENAHFDTRFYDFVFLTSAFAQVYPSEVDCLIKEINNSEVNGNLKAKALLMLAEISPA